MLGQADFITGFMPFALDPFFGARTASSRDLFVSADVAYDEAGSRLFVADMHNHRVLVFNLSLGIAGYDTAAFVLGQPDFVTGGRVAANPYGNKNTVNAASGCTTAVNGCGLGRAWSLSYDYTNQRLFVADSDNHRILVWNLAAGITSGMAASFVLGQASFTTGTKNTHCGGAGAGTINACGLSRPSDAAFSAATNRLYVADTGNHRVLEYNLSSGITNGMAATRVLGQTNMASGTPKGPCGVSGDFSCSFHEPSSLALDSLARRLYVADQRMSRVLVFDISAGVTSGARASYVLGQPDFATGIANSPCPGGTGGGPSACGLGNYEIHVDVDADGETLYVADGGNHRVLVFNTALLASGEAAIGVLGHDDFSSGYDSALPLYGGATSRSGMLMSRGIHYDPSLDRLFIADGGNHRVLVFGGNIGGHPVEVRGPVVSQSIFVNGDGNYEVHATSDTGKVYTLILPPGTTPLAGREEIVMQIGERNSTKIRVSIEALLPAGTTKSITMNKPGAQVCIADRAVTEWGAKTECAVADRYAVPAAGACVTYSVPGRARRQSDQRARPRRYPSRHRLHLGRQRQRHLRRSSPHDGREPAGARARAHRQDFRRGCDARRRLGGRLRPPRDRAAARPGEWRSWPWAVSLSIGGAAAAASAEVCAFRSRS